MKKNIAILIAIVFALVSCSNKAYLFTSFHEPADAGLRMLYSYDGYHWKDFDTVFLKPEVGTQKVMRDPSMVQGPDGVFHLVWTSSWQKDKGFGTASSKDLIHWTAQKHVPVMEHEPGAVNVWAPELFYDDVQDQYIIVWATTIPGRFERGIEPDSNNHRLYATTTKDFQTFTPARLFLDPKFSVIDAQIVKRKANDYVLILKDNTRPERNVKVAFGSSPMGPWKNISKPFTENFTEGPNTVKVKDEWLIYFDSYRKKTYEAVATKDFIHFENANNRISIPEGHKHGTIVPVKKKLVKQLVKQVGGNRS
ncbi:glycoside hydrolase family 43 protein [Niabella yanshanensis]|uniref:Glycoside hydrolase family 43 protein n=1 Tax=Niabella yanshanensis TaxID=577386 RepID=A0ABZ0W7H6_9BACT|nr:glycoside hydrolase family 43 protein [Niabella yanshanensis]WQD39243.1 glycoside hydrolase family 43 protein [Niabella yanshanensis]